MLYFAATDNNLSAIHATDMSVEWTVPLNLPPQSSPMGIAVGEGDTLFSDKSSFVRSSGNAIELTV